MRSDVTGVWWSTGNEHHYASPSLEGIKTIWYYPATDEHPQHFCEIHRTKGAICKIFNITQINFMGGS